MLSTKHLSYVHKNFKKLSSILSRKASSKQDTSVRKEGKREGRHVSEVLTDTFKRKHDYLRISLTERCNLRCQYCMPAEGVSLTCRGGLLRTDEVLRLAGLFVREGVTKIRLTGGEPLLRPDVVEVVAGLNKLKSHGLKHILMTTNGILLHKHLPSLVSSGLDNLNISLDTLVPAKFQLMARRKGLERVLKAVQEAIRVGYEPLKINTVLMRNFNDDEVLNFVAMTQLQNIDVRFIEYMPFDGNAWSKGKMVPYDEVLRLVRAAHPSLEQVPVEEDSTSKSWRVDGYKGKVSFISSMTNHFCNSCSRLRITADGNLKVCLFGSSEISLRDLMRKGVGDEELMGVVAQAVKKKKAKHAGMDEIAKSKNRPMILIGG